MIHDLSEEQKENIQTVFPNRQKEQRQIELLELKRKATTRKRNFESLNKESTRPLCNKCSAVIRLYEMGGFGRNGGHCSTCEKSRAI